MNPNIKPIFIANALKVIASFDATNHIKHSTVKGNVREAIFQSIIKPWFGYLGVGTGHIINAVGSEGADPPQCDIVVYDPKIHPPIYMGDPLAPAYFPVESVAAIIEVKSRLTKNSEFKNALLKLGLLNPACSNYQSGAPMKNDGSRETTNIISPLKIIFSFSTTIRKREKIQHYLKNSNDWNMVCILGLGTWVRLRDGNIAQIVDTKESSNDTLIFKANQLVWFAALLSDNIKDILRTRGSPGLQSYIMPSPDSYLQII